MRERTCDYSDDSLIGGYFRHRRRDESACGGCLDRMAAYYAEARRLKGRNQAIHSRSCSWCGRSWMATKPLAKFCSHQCRENQHAAVRRSRLLPVLHPDPSPLSWLQARHPAMRPASRQPTWWKLISSGPCGWCGISFTSLAATPDTAARYCSSRCARNKERVRHGRFAIPPMERQAIYERDRWTCQLCHAAVDPLLPTTHPWAATLDHVICRSWTLIPDHSPSNLRLAHRMCNSRRGDRAA